MYQPSTSNDPSSDATSRLLRGLTVSTKDERSQDAKSPEELKSRAELLQQLQKLVQKPSDKIQKPRTETTTLKIKIEYCGEKRSFIMVSFPIPFYGRIIPLAKTCKISSIRRAYFTNL